MNDDLPNASRREVLKSALAASLATPAVAAGMNSAGAKEMERAAPANVIVELKPDAVHNTAQHANNRIECDHGSLKARLRPMRGMKTNQTATVINRGHAFVQNIRRGHYELGTESRHDQPRVAAAFDELATTL